MQTIVSTLLVGLFFVPRKALLLEEFLLTAPYVKIILCLSIGRVIVVGLCGKFRIYLPLACEIAMCQIEMKT